MGVFLPASFSSAPFLAMPFFLHVTYFSKMENSYREMGAHTEETIFQIGKLNHSTKKHANEVGRTEQNCEVGQHSYTTKKSTQPCSFSIRRQPCRALAYD
jgi:hypothetical protein